MTGFTDYHFLISKEDARPAAPLKEGWSFQEVQPDYECFINLLKKVGGPYGWDRRPRYHNNRAFWESRLAAPETRMFLFMDAGKPVGYCLTGSAKEDLSSKFHCAARDESLIEIENFGLFPEFTQKGYGPAFLQAMFDELFTDHGHVYLSSRSTNGPNVVPFYQSGGMTLILSEEKPDDLIPAPTEQRKRQFA